ncbi:hypothetical protein C8J27_106131 [Rhodobacter aestuarii]|uniref:Uncharacterized protein n=1 Tax=Rhodobacter aestuarii TaxID=453582 RepID=A0A1N7M5U1_9RHOB|nr:MULTISPECIES: hypothetical protein [Rhodobacter]PTV94863.1 hypothetical protein C8J27_106131 [Rhodobacter aestuarii]SIS81403.1 hypothetical protein SAMN05421580_105131 [Rhodobacter aestuarii]SOC14090.1 hypothetical protein SAMN05877809_10768 [Rhodobacter sp. JA431]
MTELAEYERRISYALERIGRGVEVLSDQRAAALAAPPVVQEPPPPPEPVVIEDTTRIEALEAELAVERTALAAEKAALEAERAANIQLTERVRAIREKQETTLAALERRLAQATKALEAVQAEANRLKRANAELTDVNRAMVNAGGQVNAQTVNRAMQAELEALRAARAWEMAELAEILAGLEPIVAAHAKAPAGTKQPEGAEHG